MKNFEDLSLSPALVTVLKECGFKQPTAIQSESIPFLLEGRDLIGQSQTGSGKTAAFTLPILEKINLKDKKPQALVILPTRELCAQVAREIRKLGRALPGLNVLILSGGAPMGPQLGSLEKGVHIVVGTPGRILDHLSRRSLDLRFIKTCVLDEADRMLEMGFQDEMEEIISYTPQKRQTVLFSATFPESIEDLSETYQNNPHRIAVTPENQTAKTIRQILYKIEHQPDSDDRMKALLWLIEKFKPESMIVFCNFKASIHQIVSDLKDAGLSVDELHGDLEQRDRDRIMAKFRNKSLRVLVATDVAARGIDITDLDVVLNYELPKQPEIYVHRIGRTGRAGKEGLALSFYSEKERNKVEMISEFSKSTFEEEKLPVFDETFNESEGQKILENLPTDSVMRSIYISGGRKEKMRPGDILGALTGEAGGLPASEIGKIEIHDHFSYVAVNSKVFVKALNALQNGRIKGRKFKVEEVK